MKKILLSTMALAAAMTAGAANWPASRAAEVQQTAAVNRSIYKGQLNIEYMGESEATITVKEEADGKYTFILDDFSVSSMLIGDAIVSDLTPKVEEDGAIVLEATNKYAKVMGGISNTLKDNQVLMTMKATIKDGKLSADISSIEVTFVGSTEPDVTVSANFKSESTTDYNKSVCQINGGFDEAWLASTPWDSKGNEKKVGVTPEGWCVSNVFTGMSNQEMGKATTGKDNKGQAALLTNKRINIPFLGIDQKVPAYMALGTTWATAEGIQANKADGGTWGGKSFTLRPDAVCFDYKRDNSNGTENATVVAYLWKGTWTQADVPGNTNTGGEATKCTMTDRDRNVLGKEYAQGGTVTKSDDAALIASFEHSITESTNNAWKTLTIPFNYETTDTPEKINVIFSATDYFGDRTKIVGNNSLTVDNVRLVYYHSLSDLKYFGQTIEGFAEGTTVYNVTGTLAQVKENLSYTVKGAGATVEVADDDDSIVTLTVKGADYATDPSSKTVYTIIADGTYNGISGITDNAPATGAAEAIYDLSGRRIQTMQKGLNIVRGKDGKFVKVMK